MLAGHLIAFACLVQCPGGVCYAVPPPAVPHYAAVGGAPGHSYAVGPRIIPGPVCAPYTAPQGHRRSWWPCRRRCR